MLLLNTPLGGGKKDYVQERKREMGLVDATVW
jgi:hypothetical protein